jgi:anthranilate synthase/aminodeoxychorismate synthase-like glutamine amidotransferase
VCLGHQAIGEAYGGSIVRARQLMHGKTSRVVHDGKGIFAGVPSPLEVMRYHSLTIDPKSLPADLEVVAKAVDDDSEIHAVRHRTHPVWGVQFHPESVMTQAGKDILSNFLSLAGAKR